MVSVESNRPHPLQCLVARGADTALHNATAVTAHDVKGHFSPLTLRGLCLRKTFVAATTTFGDPRVRPTQLNNLTSRKFPARWWPLVGGYSPTKQLNRADSNRPGLFLILSFLQEDWICHKCSA